MIRDSIGDGPPAGAFQGWLPEGRALVEHAIAAHGGLEQWRATRSVRLTFGAASGALLFLKGYQRSFPAPREYEILLHERTTIFHGTVLRVDFGPAPAQPFGTPPSEKEAPPL